MKTQSTHLMAEEIRKRIGLKVISKIWLVMMRIVDLAILYLVILVGKGRNKKRDQLRIAKQENQI